MARLVFIFLTILAFRSTKADQLIIPMDATQKNHLKAYGIAFWVLEQQEQVE